MIDDLIKAKKLKVNDKNDEEKLELIEKICSEENCFIYMDMDMAIDILRFLDVPEDKLLDHYMKLVSPEEFLKNSPNIYNIVDTNISDRL